MRNSPPTRLAASGGCTPALSGSSLLQRLGGTCKHICRCTLQWVLLLLGNPTPGKCPPSSAAAGGSILVPGQACLLAVSWASLLCTLLQQLAGTDRLRQLLQRGLSVVGGYMSPVHDAYTKPGLLPAAHRLQMCRAAASTHPRLMVDPWEAAQPEAQRSLLVLRRVEVALLQAQQQVAPQDAATAVHAALPQTASDAPQPAAAQQGAAGGSPSLQGSSRRTAAADSEAKPEAAAALQVTESTCAAAQCPASSRPATAPIPALKSPFSNVPAWDTTAEVGQAQAAASAASSPPPALHSSPSSDTDRGERGYHPQRPEAGLGRGEEQTCRLPSRSGLDSSTRAPGVLRSGSFLDNLADLEARHSAQLTAHQVSLLRCRLRQDALGGLMTMPIGVQWTAHLFGCRHMQSFFQGVCQCACWCAADSFPGGQARRQARVQATANSSHRPCSLLA